MVQGRAIRGQRRSKDSRGSAVTFDNYHYSRIIAKYSPTEEDGFFGQFEFDFKSANDYTADMLEATAFEVYVKNGEVVGTDGFEI